MVGETLASSAPSSSSSSNNNPLPSTPTEDAWVNSYQRLLPQWQQPSSSLPHQPSIPISISRVNQVDAGRLDIEMSAMLKEQLVKVFSLMKPGMLFQYEPELDAFLEFLIWRFSIWVDKPTPGNALMNLRYRDERAMENIGKVRTGLEGPGLTFAQKIWYCVATVGGQYIWARLQSFSAFRRWGDSEQRSMARRAWYLIQRIEGFYKAASFSNLLIFLYTGRYRSLIERALQARLVYGSPHMNRAVSFEYMNRQLVWNEFSHAIAYVEDDKFYGAKATMNVWEPKIQQSNEFSLSQIWVLSGSFDGDLNSIEAGWQVSPDLYGDSNTRLFTYWTSDAYEATGCYNLLCSGFIQINNRIAMGASIFPVSNYHGPQYDISILLWKDPSEGNWWMQFGTKNEVIGYWPSFLFSNLADSATLIEWGGEVVNSQSDGQHTTTQMGSGHFPGEGFSKASYFKNLQIVDNSNHLRPATDVKTFTEQSNCYNVQTGKNGEWGNFFYYGGPGRNPNCP